MTTPVTRAYPMRADCGRRYDNNLVSIRIDIVEREREAEVGKGDYQKRQKENI